MSVWIKSKVSKEFHKVPIEFQIRVAIEFLQGVYTMTMELL